MPFGRRHVFACLHHTIVSAVALLLGVAVLVVTVMPMPASARPRRPVSRAGEIVEGTYIVTMAGGSDGDRVAQAHGVQGAAVSARYRSAFQGFTAELSPATARRLAADPRVASVEPDRWVELAGVQSPAPWGLDRIDQRSRPLNDAYSYGTTGAGVKIYILDTGVYRWHPDFGGRVAAGYDATGSGTTGDCNGHGTHVAGTAAGARYGVAKGATIVPVKVMYCDGLGLASEILEGMDWVAADHQPGEPAVANVSLTTVEPVSAVDVAVRYGILDGISYVIAAGNADMDACDVSPSRVPEALTVGATASSDGRAWFSNWGTCLDVFAPGKNIVSADAFSSSGAVTMSGTSMAAPHVAGAAARYLQGRPSASPAQVTDSIVGTATTDIVTGSGWGSPRRLLFSSPATTVDWKAAAAPSPTYATITRSAARITAGQDVRVVARLTTVGGAAVAGERVVVQRRPSTSSTWSDIATRRTDENGRVAITESPRRTMRYRLRYAGGAYQASGSDGIGVGVRTRVTAVRSDGQVQRGDDARLTGAVRPDHRGATVVLQRREDGSWRNIATDTLSADSRYSLRVPTKRRGSSTYRVVRPADADHVRGTSLRRTFTVG